MLSDDLALIGRVARNRRGETILFALAGTLVVIGAMVAVIRGSWLPLVGLTGAAVLCGLLGVVNAIRGARTARTLVAVVRDRPDSIVTIISASIPQATPLGFKPPSERAIGVSLDDGTTLQLRSLSAADESAVLAVLTRLAPAARQRRAAG